MDEKMLPDSPAGRRVAWLLERAVDGAATPEDLAEEFDPSFLASLPEGALLAGIAALGAGGGADIVGLEDDGDTVAVAVENAAGERLHLVAMVHPAEPHRIVGLAVRPPMPSPGPSWPWAEVAEEGHSSECRTAVSTPVAGLLDELVVEARRRVRAPGVGAAVVVDGEIAYWIGAGLADIEDRRRPTSASVVRIGSISKTMTALAVAQLVEEGKVDLDAPVDDYLTSCGVHYVDPSFRPLTTRHLLTHTGGLAPRNEVAVPPGTPVPPLPEYLGGAVQVVVAPGSRTAYSNDGFALLGVLVGDVDGRPFEQYAIARLFDPLGMNRTDFVRGGRTAGDALTGYNVEFGTVHTAPAIEIAARPAGSVLSTVDDMVLFVEALCGGGENRHGRVVAADTLAALFRPQDTGTAMAPGAMGLAFRLTEIAGELVVAHNGGMMGATSEMWVAPSCGVGVLVFANTYSATTGPRHLDALAHAMLGAVLSG